jgi:hypothetical protein
MPKNPMWFIQLRSFAASWTGNSGTITSHNPQRINQKENPKTEKELKIVI